MKNILLMPFLFLVLVSCNNNVNRVNHIKLNVGETFIFNSISLLEFLTGMPGQSVNISQDWITAYQFYVLNENEDSYNVSAKLVDFKTVVKLNDYKYFTSSFENNSNIEEYYYKMLPLLNREFYFEIKKSGGVRNFTGIEFLEEYLKNVFSGTKKNNPMSQIYSIYGENIFLDSWKYLFDFYPENEMHDGLEWEKSFLLGKNTKSNCEYRYSVDSNNSGVIDYTPKIETSL